MTDTTTKPTKPAVAFSAEARRVKKPTVGGGNRGSQIFKELLPYVEQARAEDAALDMDTSNVKGFIRELRKAGNALTPPATVRVSWTEKEDGSGAVTFWTVAKVVKTPSFKGSHEHDGFDGEHEHPKSNKDHKHEIPPPTGEASAVEEPRARRGRKSA